MVLKIAWRNIWRNPTRSFVVMGAIIVGIWSIIFLMGMVFGLINSYVDNAIKNGVSHIKIQQKEFIKEKENKYFIDDIARYRNEVVKIDGIKSASYRTLTNAMIGTSRGSRGVSVVGIVPDLEKNVSGVSEKMKEGDYFAKKRKNQILIGKRLADKLKMKMRSKIVLTFQNLDGDITAGAFRVSGIFDTRNNLYDESVVFIRQSDLNKLLGKEKIGHEIAIVTEDLKLLDTIQSNLKSKYPELSVRTYKEISPELELFQSQIKMMGKIYMVIFMLALVFGIINTMLMAVLERTKELGMLMAIGMNRLRVFFMIVLETIILAIVASPIGLLAGYLTTQYFSEKGINLFFYSDEGMRQFGFDKFIYPTVENDLYLQLVIAVALTALIGSIYPAIKAIMLRPVDAIRK